MSEGMPQFTTAEYAKAGEVPCKVCGKTVSGAFYRINGQTACPNCTQVLQAKFPKDSHAAFVRGLTFGIGGAILGLIIYVAVILVTHLKIGYVSLAVGYIVGKALILGARGVRGRRYQIAAVILTYFAVSMSAVPIGITQLVQRQEHSAPQSSTPKPQINVAKAVGFLAFVGLASPFLDFQDPVHGIIGLVILFVGLNIAWRLTAQPKFTVEGPLTGAPPQQAPA